MNDKTTSEEGKIRPETGHVWNILDLNLYKVVYNCIDSLYHMERDLLLFFDKNS